MKTEYPFYRSVHGYADTDLTTLMINLKKEENNICAHRGLIPGSLDQCFTVSLSTGFRAYFNKIVERKHTVNE